MSNLESAPVETPCRAAPADGAVLATYEPRIVPLGGIRGINVRRLLPQRALPTVGAWCFLDVFGPERQDMRVLPHPHTGLQTVTWPLAGEIRHRDSLGSDVVIRPGQLNLMTSGRGVAHSEFSLGEAPALHGLQLWLALPAGRADGAPDFEQHTELPRFARPGLAATVFVGELGDVRSPATVHSPLVGAELVVSPGATVTLPLRADFEHALLVIDGGLDIAGPGPLAYLGTGRTELAVTATEPTRAVLLGGTPFPDDLVMWWNFVGRDHEEIVAARAAWERGDTDRFGAVAGHANDRIPAPELPHVRLTPRRRP